MSRCPVVLGLLLSASLGAAAPTTVDLWRQAVGHYQAERYAEALPLLEQVVAAVPHEPEPQHLLGLTQFQLQRLELAEPALARAVRLAPANDGYQADLGHIRYQLGWLDEALPPLREALRLNPRQYNAMYVLGQVHLARGRPFAALEPLTGLAEGRADLAASQAALAEALLAAWRLDEAAALAERALALQADHELARRVQAAVTERRPLAEALAAGETLDPAAAPTDSVAQVRLARTYVAQRRWADAARALAAAGTTVATHPAVAELAAEIHDRVGRPAAGEVAADNWWRATGSAAARARQGWLLYRLGHLDEAETALTEALERAAADGDSPASWVAWRALIEAAGGDWLAAANRLEAFWDALDRELNQTDEAWLEYAEGELRRALEAGPAADYLLAAVDLSGDGRFAAALVATWLPAQPDAAREALELALADDAQQPELHAARARLALVAGDAGGAEAAARQALALGDAVEARRTLADLAAPRGDWAAAAEQLAAAAALQPGEPRRWRELADAHLRAARRAEALAAVDRALIAAQRHPWHRRLLGPAARTADPATAPTAAAEIAEMLLGDRPGPALTLRAALARQALGETTTAARLARDAVRLGLGADPLLRELNLDPASVTGELDRLPALERKALIEHLTAQARGLREARYDDLEVAVRRRLVDLRPADATARNEYAIALGRVGDWETSLAEARRAVELFGQPNAILRHNVAYALRSLKRYDEARAELAQALTISPELALLHNELGNVEQAAGRWPEAAAAYARAAELEPASGEYQWDLARALNRTNRQPEALAALRRGATNDPTNGRYANEIGLLHYAAGRWAEAEAAFAEALGLNRQSATYHHNRALALWPLGRRDEALEQLRQALALAPANHDYRNRLGLWLYDLARWSEAETVFRELVARVADQPLYRRNLADTLGQAGRPEEALEILTGLLATAPETADYHNLVGLIEYRRQRWEPARVAFAEAWRLAPDTPQYALNLLDALKQLQRQPEALALLTAAIERHPEQARLLNALGNLHHEQQRYDQAIDAYRRALAAEPQFATAQANLAGALLLAGRRDEALAAAKRALELGHTKHWVFARLGLQPGG